MEKSDETARFIANMQQERSIALMLTFLDDNFDAETKKINFNIEEQMVRTDLALENISDWRAPAGVDILRQTAPLLTVEVPDLQYVADFSSLMP